MELPDIISLGRPKRFDVPSPRPWPLEIAFGRYQLLRRIPSGDDDECYWSRISGPAGFEKIVFTRRFDQRRMDDVMIEGVKRQAYVNMRGVSQVFELGRVELEPGERWGFVVSEMIVGASIADLSRAGRTLPWLVALAIVHDACNRLATVRTKLVGERKGIADLALSPGRIILSSNGEITLAMGLPAPTLPSWHRAVCDVIYPILSLAATADERELMKELFADDNPDAVWVASDAIVERHPELDPVLPIVFLALAGRIDRRSAHAALVQRVPIEQLRALWNTVIDVVNRR